MADSGIMFPYEREAMRGDPVPSGLCIYDQAAFQSLRALYKFYYAGSITREAASHEKKLIRKALDDEIAAAQFQDKLAQHSAKMFKETELAKTACRKNPTPENALRLVNVLEGLVR